MDSSDLSIAIILLIPLAFGIGLLIRGGRMHSQVFSRRPGTSARGDLQTWQHLLTWHVVSPSYTVPTELDEFSRSKAFIQSSAFIGGGGAVVLAVVWSVAISLAAARRLLSLWAANGWFFIATLYLIFLIGYSLGYGYGVWRLRSITARAAKYADLQPRRLSDYRSGFILCIAGILIFWALLIPLALVPHLGSQIPVALIHTGTVAVPSWALEAIPAAMLLLLVTGEIIMSRIAKLPRLLLTSHPQTSQRADNLLRAMTIGTVQGLEFVAIGYLAYAQNAIVTSYFWQSGLGHIDTRPYTFLLEPEFFFASAVMFVGLLLPSLAGRLGGNISRWPGQSVRVP